MKFSKLQIIVTDYAHRLKQDAGYMGSYTDGGCEDLLRRWSDYKNRHVIELDLRPSEFYKLDDIEVGEPTEFSHIIERYKMQLVRDMKL